MACHGLQVVKDLINNHKAGKNQLDSVNRGLLHEVATHKSHQQALEALKQIESHVLGCSKFHVSRLFDLMMFD